MAAVRFMAGPPQALPNPLEAALDTAQVQHWALRGDFEEGKANGMAVASEKKQTAKEVYFSDEVWPTVSPETCYHLWLVGLLVQIARQGGVDVLKV